MRNEWIRGTSDASDVHAPGTATWVPTRLDVLAVTYNSEHDIVGFLDSLSVLEGQGLEVLIRVVDNASSDDTLLLAAGHPRNPAILQTGGNLGYAGAINEGLQCVPSDALVLIANPDVRLHEGFLPPVIQAATGPKVGAVSVQLVDEGGDPLPSQRREPAIHRALAEALFGGRWAARLGLGELITSPAAYRSARDVDWAAGALLAITPVARRVVGPWDGGFFLYSEETDYLLRVRDAGLRVRYEPRARAYHRGGASHSDPVLWSTLTCNRVRLFRRRHGAARSFAFFAATVLNEALRAPRHPTHRRALGHLWQRRKELLFMQAPTAGRARLR